MAAEIEGIGRIGQLAADVLDSAIDAEYPDDHRPKVGTIAVVVEVTTDEPDGPGYTHVFYRCSDPRRWVQAGFFERAKAAALLPGNYDGEVDQGGGD